MHDRYRRGDGYRYTITTAHGERRTLWHIVDSDAPESEQPAVVQTFNSRQHNYLDACRAAALLEWPTTEVM